VDRALIHGSCVAADGRALVALGRPGAGKSQLALELMALGAALVADDQVALRREGEKVIAAPPPRLAGLIEARGAGLLRVPHVAEAEVRLVVDLDAEEEQRLPPRRTVALLGVALPLLRRSRWLTPAAVMASLRHGPPVDPDAEGPGEARRDPDDDGRSGAR
jgi:HPr kinase/phosphorylase